MMRWHARTALASSFAPTSIVIGGGFFLPFFLPLVLGEDVVLLSGGGGGGASPALGFFLRGFGFFAFCGSSPFDMTSMTIALSSSLLPFLLRGGMLSAFTHQAFCYLLSCGCRSEELVARAVFGSPSLLLEVLEPLCSLVSSASSAARSQRSRSTVRDAL